MTDYDELSKRWAAGMRAAEPYMNARREAQAAVAKANRGKHKCGIRGCTRSAYRGYLCRAHYAMVPLSARIGTYMETCKAQMKAADREHRKQLRAVRELLRTA